MNETLAYGFAAGMVAFVNPCGFPMLPAYLSYFIGIDDDEADSTGRVPRALGAAGAVSLGFLAVFAVLGLPISAGVTGIYRAMPWFTLVVGAALVGMGVAMLAGRRLALALPRLERGGHSRSFASMVLFGASYAVASLSCTLPVFLTVVAGAAQRLNLLSGLLSVVAYGVGMSVVLMALSLALAMARESMVRRMRHALRYADGVAGGLLVVVGIYFLVYGVYAMDPLRAAVSPVSAVGEWSAAATSWLAQGGARLGVVLAVVVVLSVVAVALLRRPSASSQTPPVAEAVPEPAPVPEAVMGGEPERRVAPAAAGAPAPGRSGGRR
ncbi:MAG: cytochrome c biogenesis CcdA family protein [Actinomycetota bacterium]|nr:cytochrome c biogenesis CcdA family protein [Actinomycetota bacterium]